MKNRKNPNKIDGVPIQNLVAKFAHQFNKAHVFEDKNKYRRNAKHRKQEVSLMALIRVIGEADWVLCSYRDCLKHNSVNLYCATAV